MVRDKMTKYTHSQAMRKVQRSGAEMREVIDDMQARGVDVNCPMDVLTEIWNSDLEDYDAAQMICAIGMHMVVSGHCGDDDCEYEESGAGENMSALKKKWGM